MNVMIKLMDHRSPLLAQIDSDILRYIITQGVKPGERLPSLAELSAELNISISKLREQLEVARILGFVEVKPRTGIRCKEFDIMPALRLSLFYALAHDRGMFDLYSSLRVHVEVSYWHDATALLRVDDFKQLRRLVAQAWAKLRDDPITIPHVEHRRLHMGIFGRLENPFVQGILQTYWETYEAIELNRYADYAYHETVWQYHEKIVDLLAAGEYEESLKTFIEHTQLLRYQPNTHLEPSEYYGTLKVKGKESER